MKRSFFTLGIITILFFCLIISPMIALASSGDSTEKYLSIVTLDNRPISVDRLLYMAFDDIDYQASFTTDSMQTGYNMVNNGDADGVIAGTPIMEEVYTNLVKVPVVLDYANVFAFTRAENKKPISKWDDISGLKVGILTQRVYIQSQIPDDAEITAHESNKLVLEGLERGEYDVAVLTFRSEETYNLPDGIVLSGQLESFPEYLYLHKSHKRLIPDIVNSLNNMFSDGRAEKILNDIDIPTLSTSSTKTILHIISSNTEILRQQKFITELRDQFNDDESIEWYTQAFNVARYVSDESRRIYFAQQIRQDCVSKNVAAIVVSGDDALEFVKEHYLLLFRNVPVLFYSINGEYGIEIKGFEPYFTGIKEHLSAYETVSAAISLFPDTRNIYVVNDYTTEGQIYRADIEAQLKPFADSVNIEYNKNLDIHSLLAHIRSLSKDSVVLVGSYFRDGNRQYYSQKETARVFEKNCAVPIFTLHSSDLGYHAIGGKAADYGKYGKVIGDMLRQLLNGSSVSDLPIIDSEENNSWVFDKNLLDKFNLKESSLPKGAQVLNKVPSIWESDRRFAITLVALVIMVIAVSVGLSLFLYIYTKQKEHLRTAKELLLRDEKIREVNERLESIINTAPVAYVLSIDGVVVEANEYIKKHLGVKIGDKSQQFYVDPSQRAGMLEYASQQKTAAKGNVRYKMANGEIHRFLATITTVEYEKQSAYILWGMDIEQDEVINDKLRIVQQSLQTILDTMPVSIRILDIEDGTISYINEATVNMFKLESDEAALGQPVSAYVASSRPNGEALQEIIDSRNLSSQPYSREVVCVKATGEQFFAAVTDCLIDYKGKKSFLGILTDLTAKKEHERMLLHTAEKEKEANQLKSRFLVNMSHEIRTPMNAIIGLTEIELRKDIAQETADVYKKINTSAKNLLNIINDILDLSKIEADKIELYTDEIELEDVISSAMLVATPRLDGKNVEFMLNTSLDLPRYIMGDRTRLWQILKNFLDNSAKYTEKGKIVLTVYANSAQSNEETIYLSFVIEDTGIGIDEKQLQRIFMPYAQIYNEAQKKYTGTGLGMAISKQLCELMGGKLQIESRLGEGTTIHIRIPFKRSKNTETELESVKSPDLTGINILAVDDDELSLSIMSKLISGSNAKCELARSGEEALDIILEHRDTDKFFDLILLDYMMDGINGLETAKRIQMSLSAAPKLLMVTAYQRLLLKQELEKYSIDDMIEKPFIPSQFINKIRMVLDRDTDIAGEQIEVFTRFKDVNVLICEDYRLNQEVAVGMIAQFGIVSTIAENGRQGIEILNSGQSFDMILMDLQMPVMDGYEATRIIRADPRFDNIPIISLTADAMKEVSDKCMEIGMCDHISKPIDFISLHEVFLKWIPENKRVILEDAAPLAIDPMNDGLSRFGGNKELYDSALREFAGDLPEEWQDFNDAVQNMVETKRYIHKIKGAAGNLAEKDIYQYAAEFESSLHNDNPDQDMYKRLISASNIFKKKIDGQIEDNGADSIEIGTIEELKENLGRLKEALEAYDLKRSSKAVRILEEKAWPEVDDMKLRQLFKLTREYDYSAALDVLASMEEMINE